MDEFVKERQINDKVDEALKDYESNPGLRNQCDNQSK